MNKIYEPRMDPPRRTSDIINILKKGGMMKLSEQTRKFFWKLRAMWTAADMVYESQRSVLGMTIELAREVEKRIKLKKGNATLRQENEYLYRYAEEGGMDTDKFFEFVNSLADTKESG